MGAREAGRAEGPGQWERAAPGARRAVTAAAPAGRGRERRGGRGPLHRGRRPRGGVAPPGPPIYPAGSPCAAPALSPPSATASPHPAAATGAPLPARCRRHGGRSERRSLPGSGSARRPRRIPSAGGGGIRSERRGPAPTSRENGGCGRGLPPANGGARGRVGGPAGRRGRCLLAARRPAPLAARTWRAAVGAGRAVN